jgi:hypothetical protein
MLVAGCMGGSGMTPGNGGSGAGAGSTPTPSPVAHFSTLPPGSVLPSDSTCAAEVRSAPENKHVNLTYNATTGGQGLPGSFFPTSDDPRASSLIAPRVTGNYTGTTDEILQWTACKWGHR